MEVNSLSQISLENTDLVLLDLDNTLYSYTLCHHAAFQELFSGLEKHFELDTKTFAKHYSSSRQLVHNRHHGTAASHSRLFYIQDIIERLSHKSDTQLILNLYRRYWDHFISVMELYPESLDFLKNCKALNIPVVMVTDMTAEVQFQKIEKLGIIEYFSYIVTSDEAGVEKPNNFIFEYAIEKALRIKPVIVNISVVGDDIRKDTYVSDVYSVTNFHVQRGE